jgi:hypothetical protein
MTRGSPAGALAGILNAMAPSSPMFVLSDTVVVPTLEGVTTALVLFIFVCVHYPSLVKNKTQFYAAFFAVLLMILLYSLDVMIRSSGFHIFAGAVTGLLQIAALVLLFTSAGGLSVKQLAGELGRAYEVIRRGESEKTVIVPLSGEMPRPRQQPAAPGASTPAASSSDAPEAEKIDMPAEAGWPRQKPSPPQDTSSLPLE